MIVSTIARQHPQRLIPRISCSLSTQPSSSSSSSASQSDLPPPPPPSKASPKPRSRLLPHPRPIVSHSHNNVKLPTLPSSFGRNQLLPVSTSTRALLESVVAEFHAPIRYAFAYGSGVFEQYGYASAVGAGEKPPMLDFMFAVTHPGHWHSINMQQHPHHYPLHARVMGSSYIARIEEMGPGVWFNAYIPMEGVTIKYGVTTVDNLCSDLLNWRSLYLAGRMHKPLRIIKDDARVRLTQQVNLTSAARAALLTLPSDFSQDQLFEKIAGISYTGDPRMMLPAENRGKVGNIVRKQSAQFKELYQRLVVGLPGVHWPGEAEKIQQDTEASARVKHLRKLPKNLLDGVKRRYANEGILLAEEDEGAYWERVASHGRLGEILNEEMSRIVRWPATVQSLKGLVSAGAGKSIRYSAAKVSKWWKGS